VRARNKRESWWQAVRCVPPKRRLTFNGLHEVISQKTVLYKTGLSEQTHEYSVCVPVKYLPVRHRTFTAADKNCAALTLCEVMTCLF
jgi:hypothetical protein